MAEKKVYSVKGKNFILPDEVAYNQYYNINKILEDAKISVNDLADIKERGSKIKMSFGIGKVLNAILAQNKIPEFLATLLIPEGAECWEPEMVAENKDILMYMGDKSIMEMVQGFLSGRADLIIEIILYFQNFMTENSQYIENIKNAKIKTDSTTLNPELV